MASKKLQDEVARVTILGADLMSDEERKAVARWLRGVASNLISEGEDYASRFTSRMHGPIKNYI